MSKLSRFFNIVIILVMLMAALGMTHQPAAAAVKNDDVTGDMPFVPGEVVVVFQDGQASAAYTAQASALATGVNAQVVNLYRNMALLSFAEDADVQALAAQLGTMPGVVDAEPNYVWGIPEQESQLTPSRPDAPTSVTQRVSADGKTQTISIADLKAMRTINNGKITALYPNDPYLFVNWGWSWIGADIVSPNTTPSAGVCELDTGVDYTHPDLSAKIIKGYDFVNADADPMDDDGHGTHVAGIIAASQNNGKGIAGISNGKVVAVKVLNAQGWGSFFNIASGIIYCANRTDVKVLSMSLGGTSDSTYMYLAIDYAVNTKGKLLVAAAGNAGLDEYFYPARYADSFPNRVLAVAAEDDGSLNHNPRGCLATYSNYGSWVSVVAPGTNIFSTLPYSTPFYLDYYDGYYPQYDFLSGTSMATPFVAGAAARRWGYKPLEYNYQVGYDVETISPYSVYADGSCWPSSMTGIREVNPAALLDRGAAYGYIYNATTGLPLYNAQFQLYPILAVSPWVGTTAAATGMVPTTGTAQATILNVPSGKSYTGKVNLTGFTSGAQWAFFHAGGWNGEPIYGGLWTYYNAAAVPNKSGNFDVTMGWLDTYDVSDLDLNVWLPYVSTGQPAPFIVGPEGNAWGFLEGDTSGTLNAFPFALYDREGGAMDPLPLESITILKRLAHSPYVANSALPYYPGYYTAGITDFGGTIGSDTKLYWAVPYAYAWKDGVMKMGLYTGSCDAHWWYPIYIYSSASGAVTVGVDGTCTNGLYPYSIGFSSESKAPFVSTLHR